MKQVLQTNIITLTTEWKKNDFYSSILKAAIINKHPDIKVIELAVEIPAFNIQYASFVLNNTYKYFPRGTIHILCVKSEISSTIPCIIVYYDGHYFIGADNGVFSLMCENKAKIYKVIPEKLNIKNFSVFSELNLFVEVAAHLANSGKIEEIAEKTPDFTTKITPLLPTIESNEINGNIIYIDSYKNAITNITKPLFNKIRKGRDFKIYVQSNYYYIDKMSKSYEEVPSGELLAIFNNANLLEIAMRDGKLAEILNLDTKSIVRIKFEET